ncbi:hypothetical protein MmTuc01_1572 [Methanosarcina mazei Tuc01]|uniref:Uncharacterized protein n=1 Tax=Methanosarcina mazei Tuc01 TaxID=1236903 RepID=M1P918_METMZ|nr:hypothetical protein MmTuc01_1572 [Methanosarcina mazei Tuc01]
MLSRLSYPENLNLYPGRRKIILQPGDFFWHTLYIFTD